MSIQSFKDRIKFTCVLIADFCGWLSFVNPEITRRYIAEKHSASVSLLKLFFLPFSVSATIALCVGIYSVYVNTNPPSTLTLTALHEGKASLTTFAHIKNQGLKPPSPLKGFLYIEQSKYDEAIASYKKAISIDEKNPLVHYHLASAYSLKNEKNLSIEAFQRAIDLDRSLIELAKADNRLNNIRNTLAFQQLITSSEKQ